MVGYISREGGIATHILVCFWCLCPLCTSDGLASAGDTVVLVPQSHAPFLLGRPFHDVLWLSLFGVPRCTRRSYLPLQSGGSIRRRREGRLGGTSPYLPSGFSGARSCHRGAADLFPSEPPDDHPPRFTGKKDFCPFFEKASTEGPTEIAGEERQTVLCYENSGEKIAFVTISWRSRPATTRRGIDKLE
jgi:hypothetical protein